MGSSANGVAGSRSSNGGGGASVDKGVDFANYFCTYAFLYHQKEMLSDRVRMDAYFNSIFENKSHFLGKVSITLHLSLYLSLQLIYMYICMYVVCMYIRYVSSAQGVFSAQISFLKVIN